MGEIGREEEEMGVRGKKGMGGGGGRQLVSNSTLTSTRSLTYTVSNSTLTSTRSRTYTVS